MLAESQLLSVPMLYPSDYFKKHNLEYYQLLDAVRTKGVFEGRITFYLRAIKESSIDVFTRAKDIEALEHKLTNLIEKHPRPRTSRLRALSVIFWFPVININELVEQLDITFNTADSIISDFVELEVLVKETKQKRGRVFGLSLI